MLGKVTRFLSKLGTSFAHPSDRSRLRTLLGVTALEDRTVPAAMPLTGPNGGAWVKVDTLTVATRTNQTVATGMQSSVVLDAGATYLAVASGTARIANDATGYADAEFIRYNKATGPQDGSSPGFAPNNHGVRLDGVVGGTTTGNFWGPYQSDHVYTKLVQGQGTTVTSYYSDIPGYYGDNSGTLTVDLYAEVPVVSVAWVADATEGGSNGAFRFSRSGDVSQPLVVRYTVGGSDDSATPGSDYTALAGEATFAAGEGTVDVEVTALPDNEFEDVEAVQITLVAPPSGANTYRTAGVTTQAVAITDNPPQVAMSATWQSSSGSYEVGRITLTRSGGDVSQPLTVWFEPTGTLAEDGETIDVVMAATAVIPAGETTVTVPILADPATGGFVNAQMPGATPVGPRADTSVALRFRIAQAGGLAFANFIDDIKNLPLVLTYQEYELFRQIVSGQIAPAQFGTEADRVAAVAAAQRRLNNAKLDWRTVPEARLPNVLPAASGYAAVLAGAGWPKTDLKVQKLITDLGSGDFRTRENAQRDLQALVVSHLQRDDLTTTMLTLDRLTAAAADSDDAEVRRRAGEIVSAVQGRSGISAYREYKLRAAAAVAGAVLYSLP